MNDDGRCYSASDLETNLCPRPFLIMGVRRLCASSLRASVRGRQRESECRCGGAGPRSNQVLRVSGRGSHDRGAFVTQGMMSVQSVWVLCSGP